MLLVIFGAGASHDSAPVQVEKSVAKNPWKPPLTKDLFNPDAIWFSQSLVHRTKAEEVGPAMGNILTRIRRGIGNGRAVEEVLEEIAMEVGRFPNRFEQLTELQTWLAANIKRVSSEWYGALQGLTNYRDLILRLHDWQFVSGGIPIQFLTFNYDVLLENAMRDVLRSDPTMQRRLGLQKIGDYVSGGYSLFKIHGSVDWYYQFEKLGDAPPDPTGGLSEAEKATLQLVVGQRPSGTSGGHGAMRRHTLPAISVPVVNKTTEDFVMPADHFENLEKVLEQTTAVLIIGWAGAEGHFLKVLNDKIAKDVPVLLVCHDGGPVTANYLEDGVGMSAVQDSGLGFANFLNGTALDEWLESLPKSGS